MQKIGLALFILFPLNLSMLMGPNSWDNYYLFLWMARESYYLLLLIPSQGSISSIAHFPFPILLFGLLVWAIIFSIYTFIIFVVFCLLATMLLLSSWLGWLLCAATKFIIMDIIQFMGICRHIFGLLFDIDILMFNSWEIWCFYC